MKVAVCTALTDTCLSCQLAHFGLFAHPNDVIDVEISTKDDFFAAVEINATGKTGQVNTEEVGKMTVLPVVVGVSRVIEGGFRKSGSLLSYPLSVPRTLPRRGSGSLRSKGSGPGPL